MKEAVGIILLAICITAWVYILGRVTMKAWLTELDRFLGKKINNYINIKKRKENGNNEEKK
jgi:hypothetical protein